MAGRGKPRPRGHVQPTKPFNPARRTRRNDIHWTEAEKQVHQHLPKFLDKDVMILSELDFIQFIFSILRVISITR